MMIPITEQLWSAVRMYLGTLPHDQVRPMCDGLDTCKAQWQAEEQIKRQKAAERLTKQSKEKVTPIDRKKKKEADE